MPTNIMPINQKVADPSRRCVQDCIHKILLCSAIDGEDVCKLFTGELHVIAFLPRASVMPARGFAFRTVLNPEQEPSRRK